jgi:hypothetical protein
LFSGDNDDDDNNNDDDDEDDEMHILYLVKSKLRAGAAAVVSVQCSSPPRLVVAARQIDANMEMQKFKQKGLTKIVVIVDIKGVVGRQRWQESLW